MPETPAHLTESVTSRIEMSDEDARDLEALGQRLAGQAAWWGATSSSPDTTSAIRVRGVGHGCWDVRVNDAIGLIHVAGRTIPVLPKVPAHHVLELLHLAQALPRLEESVRAQASQGHHLFDLLARWFITTVETVMRRDLIRDYRPHRETLPHVRGRVDVYRTTMSLIQGRVAIDCEFDELDIDNALNRVLLAAVRTVTRAPIAHEDTRNRANRLIGRFEDVSSVRPLDLGVTVTPRTWYYADALTLARLLLSGTGFDLATGLTPATSFLIRTPEAVELGLRRVLSTGLAGHHLVEKQGQQLSGSTRTLNPDLLFDRGFATGDVKYKIQSKDWDTADLYQAVAFTTGFRARHALVITFSDGHPPSEPLRFGDVDVTNLCWRAAPDLPAALAARELVAAVGRWLVDCAQRDAAHTTAC